jgi:hypothetical protein
MKFHLKISRIAKLVLPILTSIVLVFMINQAHAETEAARIKALESEIYYDKNTGLEWLAGPDRNTTWNEAKRWVESLTAVAGGCWRMPTRKELKTLYKEGAGTRNMTPLLKTTGWGVWSGETKGSSAAWTFFFRYGNEPWSLRDSDYGRGFAVRSRRQ